MNSLFLGIFYSNQTNNMFLIHIRINGEVGTVKHAKALQ